MRAYYQTSLGKAERWFMYALIYLFLSGLVAHLVPSIYPFTRYTTDLFLLMINGTLLYFLFQKHGDKKLWWWATITYLGTFSLEAIGVATGKIFGEYQYGETMFLQFLDVPLVIALNWTVLILAVNNLMGRITQHPVLLAVLSGIFIAVYDYFIEPVAIRLDYWQWEDGTIPLQNYLAWALIAFAFSWPLNKWKVRFASPLLNIYLVVQFVYFVLLNLLL